MIKYLIEKEIKQFVRNPFLPKLAFIFPVMIILVLPFVVTMDVKNINVSVVDSDGSASSLRLIGKVDASTYFNLAGVTGTYPDALTELEFGDADVIMHIPQGFEKELLSGGAPSVMISANSTDATKGGLGSSYLSRIVSDFVNDGAGQSISASRAEIRQQFMFNPRMNYRTFMLPALMGMIIIIIGGVFPALAIVNEKERGTIEQINVTPVKKWQFIFAKLIPYWVLGIVVLTISFLLSHFVWGFRCMGSYLVIYAAVALMTAAMSGLGLIISNYSNSFQQAILLFFFVMIISLLMSGLFTPTASMPRFAQVFSLALPPRYFMEIMRGVFLKGSSFRHLLPQFLALGLFSIALCTIAVITYRKRS